MNYKYLYEQLIKNARDKNNTYSSLIHHKHHIKPRCLGGTDDSSNLVVLTFKEHFIAHLLLCKIFPSNRKLRFALNAMYNLHGLRKSKTSRLYQLHMQQIASYLGDSNRGVVTCRDKDNNIYRVSSEEFAANNELIFHTKGMVRAHDIDGNISYVTSEEFAANNELYHHTNSPLEHLHPVCIYLDTVDNIEVKLTKLQARKLNLEYKKYCYKNNLLIVKKRYKQIVRQPNNKQNTHLNFYPENYRQKGEVVCWDTNMYIHRTVTKEEYDKDPSLVGASINMVTAWDPTQQKYIKVSKKDFKESGKLHGPNKNKINVICTLTGVKSQKLKEHKLDTDIPIGGNKQLFLRKGFKNTLHYLEWKYKLKGTDIFLTPQKIEYYESLVNRALMLSTNSLPEKPTRTLQSQIIKDVYLKYNKELDKTLQVLKENHNITRKSYIMIVINKINSEM